VLSSDALAPIPAIRGTAIEPPEPTPELTFMTLPVDEWVG